MTTTDPAITARRGLTRMQVERLLSGIDPAHIESKRGLSYIAQHEARAELTRIFGVGNWDNQVESMELLWERELLPASGDRPADPSYPKNAKDKTAPYYVACYKASVRLNIRDYWGNPVCSFVEYHAESNAPLPDRGEAHAMAITSVESYALRRAAIGLGDRLGLGLYNAGSALPLVKGSLQLWDKEAPLYVETPERTEAPRQTLQEAAASQQNAQQVLAEQMGAEPVEEGA